MSLVKFSNSYPRRYNRYYYDDLFDWAFKPTVTNHVSQPSVNIKEDDNGYTIQMATPGLAKEDLTVSVDNDTLTISSAKKAENDEKKENYSKHEFAYQSFSKSYTLPDTVDGEAIKAHYENGVLSVEVPKKEEAKPKPKVEIAIS